jgi:hypothetical protein
LIYGASCTLWLSAVLAVLFELGRGWYVSAGLQTFQVEDPVLWVNVAALVVATVIVWRATRIISAQRHAHREQMRQTARDAVARAVGLPIDQWTDPTLLELCSKLAGKADKVRARADFYVSGVDSESREYFIPMSQRETAAAHLVALLTDLPPDWLLDCATNRKGDLAAATSGQSATDLSELAPDVAP